MPSQYDAIVIGAGPAGEAAISRLSEAYLKGLEALEPAA
jgi:cation diffusion facilitator CzcD-associated flavoprotein CzcO